MSWAASSYVTPPTTQPAHTSTSTTRGTASATSPSSASRRTSPAYAAHYNVQRPHRALQLRAPRPELPVSEPVHRTVRRRPVLGGLNCEYEPAARNSFSDATAEFWNSTPPPDAIRGPTTFVA